MSSQCVTGRASYTSSIRNEGIWPGSVYAQQSVASPQMPLSSGARADFDGASHCGGDRPRPDYGAGSGGRVGVGLAGSGPH